MLWTAMADDWRWDSTPESISRFCCQRVGRHGILCLHDAGEYSGGASGAPEKMLEALKGLLPEWLDRGYQFVVPCDQWRDSEKTQKRLRRMNHGVDYEQEK